MFYEVFAVCFPGIVARLAAACWGRDERRSDALLLPPAGELREQQVKTPPEHVSKHGDQMVIGAFDLPKATVIFFSIMQTTTETIWENLPVFYC